MALFCGFLTDVKPRAVIQESVPNDTHSTERLEASLENEFLGGVAAITTDGADAICSGLAP